jgi:hypothetical protein
MENGTRMKWITALPALVISMGATYGEETDI